MLALGIRYLTGYAVATDVSNRRRAEWPPHPARVFMAMAAAYFETGEDPDERAALEWIEQQAGFPAIVASKAIPRDIVTCYVPVNDMEVPKRPERLAPKKAKAAMVIIPQYRSNKQPRTFPRVRVSHDQQAEPVPVFLIWPDASPEAPILTALKKLCEKVIRIGHSSSLVQMWVEENPPPPNLQPDDLGMHRMRTVGRGTLKMLAKSYNREAIEEWADLQEQIANAKGKAKKMLREQLAERFGDREPRSLRPVISRWQGYRPVAEDETSPLLTGAFDPNLLVLCIDEGPTIGLESTWRLLTAMHKTILKQCDPTPEWLSGHQRDGSPSQRAHVAFMPLGFVGREYADGHLMGIALAFPKDIEPRERGRALTGLFYDGEGRPKEIAVNLGSLGSWRVSRELRPSPPYTLQVPRWIGPCDTWATVTPIVLDRHPKTDRAKNRQQWSLEVADVIAASCERQGLPRPVGIDVDKTSWFCGAPRAVAGQGSGFSLMPVKSGRSPRQQVHAWLRFDQPITGPLLLGAGRYRGYGVCRPWTEHRT